MSIGIFICVPGDEEILFVSNGDVVEVVGEHGDFMELKNGGWIRSKNLSSVRAPVPGLDALVKADDAPVKAG